MAESDRRHADLNDHDMPDNKLDLAVDADTPTSSIESTPDPTADPDALAGAEPVKPQKRKGGRKPIYATSEERKQRNRQAQAAFRERRTEYIKQLEATIKDHEDALRSLQQSQRSAADECLMLRYKNSLLERILLEKGIDVQAELLLKTGTSSFESAHLPAQIPGHVLSALPRSNFSRLTNRRSYQTSNIRPPNVTSYMARPASLTTQSPIGQVSPSTQVSSPTAQSHRSSMSLSQAGLPSPGSAATAQAQQHATQIHRNRIQGVQRSNSAQYQATSAVSSTSAGSGQSGPPLKKVARPPQVPLANYGYSSPFQKHIDQLEQEYDAPQHHARTETHLDDHGNDNVYEGEGFSATNLQGFDDPLMQDQQHHPITPASIPQTTGQPHPSALPPGIYAAQQPDFDSFDPMLDADPFGLSASMHFPTNYSFGQQPGK